MVTHTSPPRPRDGCLLVADAHQALRHGMIAAAGTLARAALEGHLRKLCDENPRRRVPDYGGINALVGRLRHYRIDEATRRALKRAAKTGNRCAHNRAVSHFDVFVMLDTVSSFIVSHPAEEVTP